MIDNISRVNIYNIYNIISNIYSISKESLGWLLSNTIATPTHTFNTCSRHEILVGVTRA